MTNEQIIKFNTLKQKTIKKEVYQYLKNILKNLYIEILGEYQGNIIDLMKKGLLEGWCWQTTESSIIFFNDNDYICRGYLNFNPNYSYYHSWICFNFQNKEYAFDPCLNFLCEKNIFNKIFNVDIKSKIPAKIVKEDLIYKLQNKESKKFYTNPQNKNELFMTHFLEKYTLEKKDEILIKDTSNDDINSPMYRNYTGYTPEFENNHIKTLKAHYYYKF